MKRLAGCVSAVALVLSVACAQTDSGITTSIKSKLVADDLVKANQVEVMTENHVVTLSGEVDTSAAKDEALKIARETNGVREVVDRLRVAETAATSGALGPGDRVQIEIKDDAAANGQRAADAVKDAAKETKNAARKVGKATVKGAKKAGDAVKDSVTDKDRDSDDDGK